MTTILRLMGEKDQRAALEQAVAAVRGGTADARVFAVDPALFQLVPGAPFAYWVSAPVIHMFKSHPAFESSTRTARRGPSTCDDSRYLRLWQETGTSSQCQLGEWKPFAKGGTYSRFYFDVYLVVHWEPRRSTFLGFFGRPGREIAKLESVDCFFRPGITWPRRTQIGLGMRALPAGCIFADKGSSAFIEGNTTKGALALLAVTTSAPFCLLVDLQMAFGSYEVGVIQRTPVPDLTPDQQTTLAALARRAWSLQRQLDTVSETSHAFHLPARLQALRWGWDPVVLRAELAQIQTEIDNRCFDLYSFSAADRLAAQSVAGGPATSDTTATNTDQDEEDAEEAPATVADPVQNWAAVCTWAIGVAFGRFDVRLALAGSTRPAEPEPFDPLPACSPGMLAGPDGQPAREVPPDYPLTFPADGVLVDDPGHDLDLIGRMQRIFDLVFTTEAEARWNEAAAALDPKGQDLRTWLRREAFGLHLKTHSKSRRKAPLYWPLSTASGQYTVWIYAHRVTADTLFAINDRLVKTKTESEALKLARMVADAGPTPSSAQRLDLEVQENLANELRSLRDDLTNLTPLLQPFFDDGIVIWSSVLWPLITSHAAWQKELRSTWTALAAGNYDWAQLAMRCWPERVIPKCQTDRSLAIAHDLESIFWHQDADEKWQPTIVPTAEVERLIRERQSPAVTAARDWLLARSPAGQGATKTPRAVKPKATPRPPKSDPAAIPTVIDPALAQRILTAIGDYPDGAAKADIQAALGLDNGTWNKAITALLTSGAVSKTGEKSGTRYHLNQKAGA